MKKILTLAIVACFFSGLHAQYQEYDIRLTPATTNKQRVANPAAVASVGKTANDKVSEVDSSIIRNCENVLAAEYANPYYPDVFQIADPNDQTVVIGYLGGTSGPLPGQADNVSFESFVSMHTVNDPTNLNNWNCNWTNAVGDASANVVVKEILFPTTTEGVPLYLAKRDAAKSEFDPADTLSVRFFRPGGTFNASVAAPCILASPGPSFTGDLAADLIAVRPFTVDDLTELTPHKIVFAEPVPIDVDTFWMSIQVGGRIGKPIEEAVINPAGTFPVTDTLAPAIAEPSNYVNPGEPATQDGEGNWQNTFQCGERDGVYTSAITIWNSTTSNPTARFTGQRMATFAIRTSQVCPHDFAVTDFVVFPVFEANSANIDCEPNSRASVKRGGLNFYQPYPNPATNRVNIRYELANAQRMSIRVIDNLSRTVDMIDLGVQSPGNYVHEINTSRYTAGNYYIQINHGGEVTTQKLIVQ